MVHPAAFAISLGIGLGAALFLIFNTFASRTSPYRETSEERPNRSENSWRDPYNAMRYQFENDICSVCLESLTGSTLNLECRHRFHRECIERSLQHSPLCPMCRADVKIRREF